MKKALLLTAGFLLSFASSSWATIIELDMTSLPSAQGWTYETGNPAVPETTIFSADGTYLNMNSMGQGSYPTAAWFTYNLYSGIDFARPYEIRSTARINAAEGDTVYYLYSETSDRWVNIITYPGSIFAVDQGTIYTGNMMGDFHDYRLVVNPGSGFSFYLDNSFIYSGPLYDRPSFPNHVGFGDGSGHPNTNANVDFAAFSVSQPIPEPSTFLVWSLLAGLGIGYGWYRRKR